MESMERMSIKQEFALGAGDFEESGSFHFTLRPEYEEELHAQEREGFAHEHPETGIYATPGRGVNGESQN